MYILVLKGEKTLPNPIMADEATTGSMTSNGFFCVFGFAKTALYNLLHSSYALAASENLHIE